MLATRRCAPLPGDPAGGVLRRVFGSAALAAAVVIAGCATYGPPPGSGVVVPAEAVVSPDVPVDPYWTQAPPYLLPPPPAGNGVIVGSIGFYGGWAPWYPYPYYRPWAPYAYPRPYYHPRPYYRPGPYPRPPGAVGPPPGGRPPGAVGPPPGGRPPGTSAPPPGGRRPPPR